jgi:hypothetical protein
VIVVVWTKVVMGRWRKGFEFKRHEAGKINRFWR